MSVKRETQLYLPAAIANYFLWKAEKEGVSDMTPMKVIKLVYIAFAWHLALLDRKLFEEEIQAWDHGPVIPSLYHEFKRYRNHPVKEYAMEYSFKDNKTCMPFVDKNDSDTLAVLSGVWDYYKGKSAVQLRNITHEDVSPWRKAYVPGHNNPIDDMGRIRERAREAIKKYIATKEEHVGTAA